MNIKLLPVLVSLGMAGAALTARADVADFSFSGSGVSGQGTITYTTVSGGADTVTGATGTFVDSNVGYNGKPSLVSGTITGVYAINPVDPLHGVRNRA